MARARDATAEYNAQQRSYFERTVKRTMLPVGSPYLRRQVDDLCATIGLQPGGGQRVLEVGCGMGRYTLLLAERGMAIEGMDISPVLLQRLSAFNGGRFEVPLHECDVAALPGDLEGRFDAVVGFFVLHHVEDLVACFRGVARALKPGGQVAFLEPNPLNPLYYVQIIATPGMSWRAERGMMRMRPLRMRQAMAAADLHGFSVRRFGFFPPFLANLPLGARIERRLESIDGWRPLLPFQIFRAQRGARSD